MVDDKELDKFIEGELEKDITQEETIDKDDMEQKLGEMGFLWDRVSESLKKDGVCFHCKKEVDFSGGKVHVLQASKTDKGVVAFVAVCEDCRTNLEKKGEKKDG